jgi:hypothetical protein
VGGNFRFWSNATVEGEGKKGDYWNCEEFIEAGFLDGRVQLEDYCK